MRLRFRRPLALYPVALCFMCLQYVIQVSAEEVLVDDGDISIEYSPTDAWQQGSECSSCTLSPDVDRVHNGTWHDTTFLLDGGNRTITFRFTGVAISAYFIIPDRQQGIASVETSLIFSLDGVEAGSYTHVPSGSADFLYNQTAFSRDNLSDSAHVLGVHAAAGASGGSTSVLFDYFIYSTATEPSTSLADSSSLPTESSSTAAEPSNSLADSPSLPTGSSSTNTSTAPSRDNVGTIVGGVVGAVLGSLLLVMLLLCWRKSRRSNAKTILSADDIQSPTSTAAYQTGSLRNWFPNWFSFFSRSDSSSLISRPVVFTEQADDTRNVNRFGSEKRLIRQNANHAATSRSPDQELNSLPASPVEHPSTITMLSQVAQLQAMVISLQEQRMREDRYGGSAAGGGFVGLDSESVGHASAPPEYSRVT